MSDPVERFLSNLTAAFQRKLDSETFNLYYQKLARWHLRPDQWSAVASKVISEEESFPKLASIFPYLKGELAPRGRTDNECYWQAFTIDGTRWFRKIDDPMRQPPYPETSTDRHFCPPPGLETGEQMLFPVDRLVKSIAEEVPF